MYHPRSAVVPEKCRRSNQPAASFPRHLHQSRTKLAVYLVMFASNRTPGQIRRVVTGFDSNGISIIQSDSVIDPQSTAPGGNAASTTIWTTDTFPTPVLDSTDGATRNIQGMGIRSPNGISLLLLLSYLLKSTK
jgi:hypothetical protein